MEERVVPELKTVFNKGDMIISNKMAEKLQELAKNTPNILSYLINNGDKVQGDSNA